MAAAQQQTSFFPHTSAKPQLSGVVQMFLVSASASAIGATSVYPLDLVKTRLQNQQKLSAGTGVSTTVYKNSWDCLKNVINKEGLHGLYRGLNVNLIGQVPEKAIRLVVVDTVRGLFEKRVNNAPNFVAELVAGLAAGTGQVIITNPMEIIKVRLQVAGQKLGVPSPSTLTIAGEVGLRGMYKGASACFARDIPFSGIYFPVYAFLKDSFKDKFNSFTTYFAAATVAGMAAAGLTTPADVVKTRLQVAPTPGVAPYRGLLSTFIRIFNEEGFSALWKGLGPRILRSAPQYGVMLMSFELLQSLLKSDEDIHFSRWEETDLSLALNDKWRAFSKDPPKEFKSEASKLRRICVGRQGNIWGLDKNGHAHTWTGFEWKTIGGQILRDLSVGADGSVSGVDRVGRVYQWDPWKMTFKSLQSSPTLVKVSVESAHLVWGISQNGIVYRGSTGRDGAVSWREITDRGAGKDPLRARDISVGADGTVAAINFNNEPFIFNTTSSKWCQMGSAFPSLERITVGSEDNIWGLSQNRLYLFKKNFHSEKIDELISGKWVVHQSEPLEHVSAAADGTVVGVPADAPTISSPTFPLSHR
eukprot:TRINITY_DN10338_c0_g1_i1.p1 TRINITY_DN10338_c0_g1~~TRINITY_DN10338_c0_g1_i1.p1  ORF type:complete len:587 (-),score=82.74 TRINITY_DN10338_c0_g1_i1:17-1777(-)